MNIKLLTLATSVLISSNSLAYDLQIPETDTSWYYSMGGQRSMSAPPSYNTNSIVLGGSANWGSGFNCSAFDPTLGIANTLNSVKSGADAIQQQVTDAATGAIASLPLLMLQRANPGLYELLMNSMASAEQRVSVATKSCEQMQENISDGLNPTEGWITISRSQDWKGEMGDGRYRSSNVDAVAARENVETKNGENGVYWIGGQKAGGRGQRPINVPSDIVKAGYNNTFNRDPLSNADAPQDGSRLSELWNSPEEMMEFSRSVLGEERVRTYSDRPTETLPGRGLVFEVNREVEKLTPTFNEIINGGQPMDGDNLLKISAPNVIITAEIVQSIQKLPPIEANILTSRLVQEVATARVIEKALTLRRLLNSGLQEPNVAQNGIAKDAAKGHSDELADAIENTLFEMEMNKRLASSTTQTIRQLGMSRQADGTSIQIPQSRDVIPQDAIMSNN